MCHRPVSLWIAIVCFSMHEIHAQTVGNCSQLLGPYIEGAAVDKQGQFYAVNWRDITQRNTIAIADGNCGLRATVTGPAAPVLLGLRILPNGAMLVTDQANNRLVMILNTTANTYCDGLALPNDLTITSSGNVYVSGQNWTRQTIVGDGGLWLCRKGKSRAVRLAKMGRTNGIDLSPDERSLYLSESFNADNQPIANKIWKFVLKPDGSLGKKTLLYNFAKEKTSNVGIDGMRVDIAGNLYVTRKGGRSVVKLSPAGKVLARYDLNFSEPSNLELGGVNGTTLMVVGRCGVGVKSGPGTGCVDLISVDQPGRYWSMLQKGLPLLG